MCSHLPQGMYLGNWTMSHLQASFGEKKLKNSVIPLTKAFYLVLAKMTALKVLMMMIWTQNSTSRIPLLKPLMTTLHKPGKRPSPMSLMHIIQWNNPRMPTEYKHFFNHLKPLKTNHLIKLLKADPHLKFSFLHYQPLTYPFQSQHTTFQAGTFLKICHNLQFKDGVEAMLVLS